MQFNGNCIIINLERWKENFLPAELLLFKDELEEEVFGVSLRFGLILLDKFDIFFFEYFFLFSIKFTTSQIIFPKERKNYS